MPATPLFVPRIMVIPGMGIIIIGIGITGPGTIDMATRGIATGTDKGTDMVTSTDISVTTDLTTALIITGVTMILMPG